MKRKIMLNLSTLKLQPSVSQKVYLTGEMTSKACEEMWSLYNSNLVCRTDKEPNILMGKR